MIFIAKNNRDQQRSTIHYHPRHNFTYLQNENPNETSDNPRSTDLIEDYWLATFIFTKILAADFGVVFRRARFRLVAYCRVVKYNTAAELQPLKRKS
ncbi:hypothetical protein WA026_003369 [Henosepilachna vigintioctopunctata]|uniref:Uncharacterized protein n=1 Tax=Henosepilachna vigintioctopunctata TaxID=420089 RepID=A0AAW1THE7_9CUCU